MTDPEQKIGFVDGRWMRAPGGGAAAEHADGNVYLAMSLRNVDAGIGMLQGPACQRAPAPGVSLGSLDPGRTR